MTDDERRAYHRDWYHRHKKAVLQRRKARRADPRAAETRRRAQFHHVLDAYQTFLGCAVCGWSEHAAGLEFHHVDPNTKDAAVSDLRECRWDRIWREVAKCVVVCSRCHRLVEKGIVKL